jgi:hypothetical protein
MRVVQWISELAAAVGMVLYAAFMLHMVNPGLYHRLLDWCNLLWEHIQALPERLRWQADWTRLMERE